MKKPKITIKTNFWKKEAKHQVEKLIKILYWTNVFYAINIIYFFFQKNTTMIILNSLICLLLIIIQKSYKKHKKQEE